MKKTFSAPRPEPSNATKAFFRRVYSTCGGDRLFSCHLQRRRISTCFCRSRLRPAIPGCAHRAEMLAGKNPTRRSRNQPIGGQSPLLQRRVSTCFCRSRLRPAIPGCASCGDACGEGSKPAFHHPTPSQPSSPAEQKRRNKTGMTAQRRKTNFSPASGEARSEPRTLAVCPLPVSSGTLRAVGTLFKESRISRSVAEGSPRRPETRTARPASAD